VSPRAEGAAGVDRDRVGASGAPLPRWDDPEAARLDGPVEALPALLPVDRNLARGDRTEDRGHPGLPARVGVGGELELLAPLGLLEALGEQRAHVRPRRLGGLAVDGDRDPPEPAQRNALFSFSKNPSSVR
jgi:hypothetical protein